MRFPTGLGVRYFHFVMTTTISLLLGCILDSDPRDILFEGRATGSLFKEENGTGHQIHSGRWDHVFKWRDLRLRTTFSSNDTSMTSSFPRLYKSFADIAVPHSPRSHRKWDTTDVVVRSGPLSSTC